MARSTINLIDKNVGTARPKGDAVVAGPDVGHSDRYSGGHTDVDAVCVGAISRGNDLSILNSNTFASEDRNVEVLAVDHS